MHSLEESFSEGRVPGGMQFMSVVTRLSTVQIVFMNRFLVEFLDYLAGVCVCVYVGERGAGAGRVERDSGGNCIYFLCGG
jgi:hypothetical protein